jgi:tRNA A-37 threonylcarbamoyl transferase component Bud32
MDELEVGINISQNDTRQAGSQEVDIMHRLRDHNIIHFGLRLANCIVSTARPLRAVIIDFAMSWICDKDETDA